MTELIYKEFEKEGVEKAMTQDRLEELRQKWHELARAWQAMPYGPEKRAVKAKAAVAKAAYEAARAEFYKDLVEE